MDNATFNVRGETIEQLADAIKLACACMGHVTLNGVPMLAGWEKDPKRGVVLYWHYETGPAYSKDVSEFLGNPDYKELARDIIESLREDWTKTIPMEGWDADADHDGSNSRGWRAYTEDWGYIGGDHYAFLCVMPSYCWHGK